MQLVDFLILAAFCAVVAIVQHLGGHVGLDGTTLALLFGLLVLGRALKGERL